MNREQLVSIAKDVGLIGARPDLPTDQCPLMPKLERFYQLASAAERGACIWSGDSDDSDQWEGSCGIVWCLMDGTPEDNDMAFCSQCGGRVEVHDAAREREAGGDE